MSNKCFVPNCELQSEFSCEAKISHPHVPAGKRETALLCNRHKTMFENDELVWEWFKSGDLVQLRIDGIHETRR